MATTTPKRLAIGQITDATLNTLYTAPSGVNTRFSKLSFTNTESTGITLDIYHNDGSTDYLQRTITLPGGSGKEAIYYDIQRTIANAGDVLKVQASSAITFNYSVHGSETEV